MNVECLITKFPEGGHSDPLFRIYSKKYLARTRVNGNTALQRFCLHILTCYFLLPLSSMSVICSTASCKRCLDFIISNNISYHCSFSTSHFPGTLYPIFPYFVTLIFPHYFPRLRYLTRPRFETAMLYNTAAIHTIIFIVTKINENCTYCMYNSHNIPLQVSHGNRRTTRDKSQLYKTGYSSRNNMLCKDSLYVTVLELCKHPHTGTSMYQPLQGRGSKSTKKIR